MARGARDPVRDELAKVYVELEDLAARAGTKEAERIMEAWLKGKIGDEEALSRLRTLAEAR